MRKTPVLITGIHRSGSTWLGKIMGMAPELKYIHEPFNFRKNPEAPFTTWFKYLSEFTCNDEQEIIRKYLEKKQAFHIGRIIEKVSKAKYPGQVRDAIRYELKYFTARPLFKDPIAFMSAEWLQKTYNADVIVLIRHPAAFVASLKVAGWKFDFRNLLDQKILIENELAAYKNNIVEIIQEEERTGNQNIIEQGILLWNCFYSITKIRRDKYQSSGNWLFVKHEDLSLRPIDEIKKIFIKFDLNFTPKICSEIKKTTQSEISKSWERDASRNISTWKNRLEKNEISIIKEKTFKVWSFFYDERDWI